MNGICNIMASAGPHGPSITAIYTKACICYKPFPPLSSFQSWQIFVSPSRQVKTVFPKVKCNILPQKRRATYQKWCLLPPCEMHKGQVAFYLRRTFQHSPRPLNSLKILFMWQALKSFFSHTLEDKCLPETSNMLAISCSFGPNM